VPSIRQAAAVAADYEDARKATKARKRRAT